MTATLLLEYMANHTLRGQTSAKGKGQVKHNDKQACNMSTIFMGTNRRVVAKQLNNSVCNTDLFFSKMSVERDYDYFYL